MNKIIVNKDLFPIFNFLFEKDLLFEKNNFIKGNVFNKNIILEFDSMLLRLSKSNLKKFLNNSFWNKQNISTPFGNPSFIFVKSNNSSDVKNYSINNRNYLIISNYLDYLMLNKNNSPIHYNLWKSFLSNSKGSILYFLIKKTNGKEKSSLLQRGLKLSDHRVKKLSASNLPVGLILKSDLFDSSNNSIRRIIIKRLGYIKIVDKIFGKSDKIDIDLAIKYISFDYKFIDYLNITEESSKKILQKMEESKISKFVLYNVIIKLLSYISDKEIAYYIDFSKNSRKISNYIQMRLS
jgi:hypothetical protein